MRGRVPLLFLGFQCGRERRAENAGVACGDCEVSSRGTVNLSSPRAIFAGSPPRFTRSRVTYEAYAVSRTSTRPQVDSAVETERGQPVHVHHRTLARLVHQRRDRADRRRLCRSQRQHRLGHHSHRGPPRSEPNRQINDLTEQRRIPPTTHPGTGDYQQKRQSRQQRAASMSGVLGLCPCESSL